MLVVDRSGNFALPILVISADNQISEVLNLLKHQGVLNTVVDFRNPCVYFVNVELDCY